MAPHLAAKNRKPCVPHGRLCGIPSEPLEPSARLTGLQRVRAASPIPLSPAARGVLIGKTPLPPQRGFVCSGIDSPTRNQDVRSRRGAGGAVVASRP
jgi:hypothetical protein